MDLVVLVYNLMLKLPSEEKFGIISQIKRSAVSIPSNIAEGAGRSSTREFIRFLDIATGSLSELETQLILVYRLGYCKEEEILSENIKGINQMLFRLKESLKKKL